MKRDFFEGPYYVKDRIGKVTADLEPGAILIRCDKDGEPNGIIALRCPACLSVQFRHGYVEGTDKRPTIDRVLECGCKSMCGAQFQIRTGKAEPVETKDDKKPAIPESLRKAGVKPPPENICK